MPKNKKKSTNELLAIGKFSFYSEHLLPGNKLLKTKEVNEAPNLIGYLQNQTVIRLRVKMFTITCYFLYIFPNCNITCSRRIIRVNFYPEL